MFASGLEFRLDCHRVAKVFLVKLLIQIQKLVKIMNIFMRMRTLYILFCSCQRWSPRGHILKALALASRPQVLENWPILGSRTAVFFELLKFCGALEKFFGKGFFVEIA